MYLSNIYFIVNINWKRREVILWGRIRKKQNVSKFSFKCYVSASNRRIYFQVPPGPPPHIVYYNIYLYYLKTYRCSMFLVSFVGATCCFFLTSLLCVFNVSQTNSLHVKNHFAFIVLIVWYCVCICAGYIFFPLTNIIN